MDKKKRILTADRPTGKLHLGHYVGSLQNRVKLQNEYDTFIMIADVQAMTTNFDRPEKLRNDVIQVTLDNIAVGLEPEKITMFIQSTIPEIAELTIFYSMFVSVNTLRHNPTVKTEIKQYGYDDVMYGFLGYPISQTADITFCKADLVPVGEDQMPHMELTKKIVRRFNSLYKPILVEPESLLGSVPRLVGLDGNAKMGKSLNNSIYLSDEASVVKQKVFSAVTDPSRIKITDKGNPDICIAYEYHKAFNILEVDNIREMCKSGNIGCTACKNNLTNCINEILDPIRERRNKYEQNIPYVKEVLHSGTKRAREIAKATMEEIREAMRIDYFTKS